MPAPRREIEWVDTLLARAFNTSARAFAPVEPQNCGDLSRLLPALPARVPG
jgi:hypothetical protein